MPPTDQEAEAFIRRHVDRLPPRWRGRVARLRAKEARWARLPAGLLLVAGGVFWFLPLVGLWMLPLGLLLLAEDTPWLKRRLVGALMRLERRRERRR